MASGSKGHVVRGAGLALRDWPCFLWLYLANYYLAVLPSAGFAFQVGGVLNHSLAAERLAHGFDLAVFLELLLRPEVTPRALFPISVFFAVVFALVTLFLTAGIVQSFLSDEHLRIGPFFQACGAWLWRFTRLTFLTLLIFGIVMGVMGALRAALMSWADKSPNPRLYFYAGLGSLLVLALVAIKLRLWFDLAQFHLVHTGERKVRRAIPAGVRLLRRGFLRLYGIYLGITVVGWAGLAAGMWLWVKLPPARVGLAFLVGHGILILWLGTRYWQRAAAALWFREHAPALPPAVPPPAEVDPAALTAPAPAGQHQ